MLMQILFLKNSGGKMLAPNVKCIGPLWCISHLMALLLHTLDRFVHGNNISNYSLRDAENKLAMPRTNYMKNSFSYSGTVL